MARRKKTPDYFLCPHCGAKVRVGAVFCRECGAEEEMGWSEDAETYAEADIPGVYGGDDDFDYDEFLEKEFPGEAPVSAAKAAKKWLWAAVVIALCVAMLLYLVC
jgi:hypothetical protein